MSAVPGTNAATRLPATLPVRTSSDGKQHRQNDNDIALRHGGARLRALRGNAYRNRGMSVRSALAPPPETSRTDGNGEEADQVGPSSPLVTHAAVLPAPLDSVPLPGQLDEWIGAQHAQLVAIRRHIHANPELSGAEFGTAALVEKVLREAGLEPRLMAKGNGVICDIGSGRARGGRSRRRGVIALRADLDALPLPDTKDVPYRSTVPNVCHACGHDVHTTILLGAGLALAELDRRGELHGRVRLIFQPSEERVPSGAPEVISEGGLKDVETIFALHCFPQLPAGLVAVRSGPLTAAADVVEVRLSGPGGHTARPHLTADLVHALGRVVVDVPNLLSRRVDQRAGLNLTFGAIQAGEAANAIPIEGHVRGTVRVLSREAWRDLPALVPQLIRDAVAGTGVEVDVDYVRGVPPVINDPAATALIATAATAALGPDRVVEAEISMGGEDFAFYVDEVPGAMIRLGVASPGGIGALDIHQSSFDVDERAIDYGVRVFVHTALSAIA
jgi:amidohydrolase